MINKEWDIKISAIVLIVVIFMINFFNIKVINNFEIAYAVGTVIGIVSIAISMFLSPTNATYKYGFRGINGA